MNFENPTRLRIGMHGNFGGKDYRLIGRSVLGEMEGGETYYWNEFLLETKSGEQATLVYDQSERRSQWRLFTQFEPDYPMNVADAAAKRVGEQLNLTGDDVRVTFRGSSRVYHVEGQPPEGEAVGTRAEYFNAESGSVMQVVSWTGDELEYYNGVNLTTAIVAAAFKMPAREFAESAGIFRVFGNTGAGSDHYLSGTRFAVLAAIAIILFLIIFARGLSCSMNFEAGPAKTIAAGAPPLAIGAAGMLFNKKYQVAGHEIVEIAEVAFKWERHEYQLTNDDGGSALLVCGQGPYKKDWIYLEPVSPLIASSPAEMAAKNIGDPVQFDGYAGKVSKIFRSTVKQVDGEVPTNERTGTVLYGLCTQDDYHVLLVRWNAAGIQYFHGRTIAAQKGAASFTASH